MKKNVTWCPSDLNVSRTISRPKPETSRPTETENTTLETDLNTYRINGDYTITSVTIIIPTVSFIHTGIGVWHNAAA